MWLWIIAVSAIWVLFDAKSIGVRKGVVSGLGNIGPWGWFFVVAFLWIIGFPMYLYYRGKFKEALSTEGTHENVINESKNGLSFIHWIGIIVFGGIALLALFGQRDDGTTGIGRIALGQSSVYTIKVTGTEGLAFSGSYMGVSSSGSKQESVDGYVPATYTVKGDIVSVSFQKQSESGYLAVEIESNGRIVNSSSTTAQYGVVSVASN